jgi:hypothetical protein
MQLLVTGQSPFAGFTLHPQEMLEVRQLAKALAAVVATLGAGAPEGQGPEGPLFTLLDQHEADGGLSVREPSAWSVLRDYCQSGESLFRERGTGILISRGFYDPGTSFYLRIHVMEDGEDQDYPGRYGDFDLSASTGILRSIQQSLSGSAGLVLTPARRYFEQRSAS